VCHETCRGFLRCLRENPYRSMTTFNITPGDKKQGDGRNSPAPSLSTQPRRGAGGEWKVRKLSAGRRKTGKRYKYVAKRCTAGKRKKETAGVFSGNSLTPGGGKRG